MPPPSGPTPPRVPRRVGRAWIAGTLLLALACGAQAVRRAEPPVREASGGGDASAVGRDAAAVDAAAPVDPLAELATSKDEVAPGMREVKRAHLELGDAGVVDLPAATVDTCFRVALAAQDVVDVSLVDGSGATLAEARGTRPRLGPRGPVCVRKGQTPSVTVRGAGTVDAIIWASP